MILLMVAIFGLCLGSFVNALVWRLHEQGKVTKSKKPGAGKKKKDAKGPELSILNGRSMCPHCRHVLSAADLVPVFSWLSLKGKCRYCHKPIGWQYPLAELTTAALFLVSYIWWPMEFNAMGSLNFAVWLVMLTGFMALLIYDLRWLLLPNRIVYPLITLAAAAALTNMTVFGGGARLLWETLLSVGIAGGLFYGVFEFSKGRWIGGGDVKLGFLIGLLIPSPAQAFLVLFVASLLGTLVILPGLAAKRLTTQSKVPFGPFLIVAAIFVRLMGAAIVSWYRHKFLFY